MAQQQSAPDRLDINGNPITAAPDRLDAQGNPVTAQPNEISLTLTGGQHMQAGPQTFDDTPLPEDWKTRLAAAMEGMAHPKTWADIGALILGGADAKALNKGASLAAEAVADAKSALSSIPVRTIASTGLDFSGRMVQSPLRTSGGVLRAAAKAIGKTPAAAAEAAPVAAEAAPAVEAATIAAKPAAAQAGPIYHPEPTMQSEFAKKAAERKAAADAAVDVAKKATKAPKAPVLGKNVVAIKNGIPDLTPDETHQALQWLQDGIEPDAIIKRLNDVREARAIDTFRNLPSPEEAAAEVKARRHYIQYPKNKR